MTSPGDKPAVEQDLRAYLFEDDPQMKTALRTAALGMVRSHVSDQEGSASMAHLPLMKSEGRISCRTPFWWFTMVQIPSDKDNVENYPTDGTLVWDNYSINWTKYLQQALGPNGDVTEEGLKKIFNGLGSSRRHDSAGLL